MLLFNIAYVVHWHYVDNCVNLNVRAHELVSREYTGKLVKLTEACMYSLNDIALELVSRNNCIIEEMFVKWAESQLQ